MGQLAKKWGGKRNGWIAANLPIKKVIPNPQKCQIISIYLALISVGRIISDVDDRISLAGDTCTLKCAPRPPPGTINLRRTGPLTAPPRFAKGPSKGKGRWGQKVFAAGAQNRRIPSEKQTAVLGPGRDKAMALLRVHRNALDQAELPPAVIAVPSVPPDIPSRRPLLCRGTCL